MLSYQAQGAGPRTSFGLGKSPDGRIWRFDHEESARNQQAVQEGRAANSHLWKAVSATGPWSEKSGPFFADDRRVVFVKQTPIRLEIDFGDPKWARSHGEKIVVERQKRGYSIGRAGLVLRVQARTVPTTVVLRLGNKEKVNIPRVDYVWRMLDSQGHLAWTATSSGQFVRDQSKYFKMSRVGDTAMEDLYDFKGKPVEEAIVNEILEKGVGLAVPENLPTQLLFGGGEYAEFPQSLPWTWADSKP